MIGYLKGKLLHIENGNIILDVNGVGYEIYCSANAFMEIYNKKEGALYIHTQVKEDDITLYGFISIEERKFFHKLISVSGVGCKMGIAILAGMRLQDLAIAIASADSKKLAQIKGLGKKTAERIILELCEKIEIENFTNTEKATLQKNSSIKMFTSLEEDAILGLMGLGYSKYESEQAIQHVGKIGANTIEEYIRMALQYLSNEWKG